MKPLNPTLRAGDYGAAVANLQEVLDVFGFRTEGTERIDFRFGRMTQQVLLAFQKENSLDSSGELDQPTADRLNLLLNAKNLLTYRVSGRVLNQIGEPLMRQNVLVFDVDLRGAGRYRTAQTLAELQQQGGFQELGKAVTNSDGFYSVPFGYKQFNAAEKGLADVVAFALLREQIVGSSRLSTNLDYTNGLDLEQWDITLVKTKERSLSEFDRLNQDVAPLLQSSDLRWFDLDDTGDQLQFLAQETGYTTQWLAVMIRAAKVAHLHEFPDPATELLYGLGRQDVALEWAALSATPVEALQAALSKSIQENIIGLQKADAVKDFLEKLTSIATKNTLKLPVGARKGITLEQTLSVSLKAPKQQTAFLDAHRSFTGTPQQFWNEFLPAQDAFRNQPKAIEALKLTNQLSVLTDSHLPLIYELQDQQGIKAAKDLLKLTDTDWIAALEKVGLPADVQDAKAYISQIQNLLNTSYPTERIGLMVEQNQIEIGDANVRMGVKAFFKKAAKFDISYSRVDDFNDTIRQVGNGQHELVREELLTFQRLYQISPSPEVLSSLKSTGLRSAYEISSIPEQTFLAEYGKTLGGIPLAKAVHDRATYQTARLEHATIALHETLYGATPAATTLAPVRLEVEAAIAQQLPNYQELLGSADLCECQHCQSIYSASAYFVDLLRLLSRSKVPGRPQTALDILLARRPDLAHLSLSCENTDTLIPHIDLVNEPLEYYVVHGQLDAGAAHDISGAVASELRASPQYTLTEAYKKLATEAIYPTSLPYHQPIDSIRTFLNYWQLSRASIMDTFGLAPTARSRHALTAERLGLTEKEYEILTDEDFDGTGAGHPAWEYYGFANQNELLAEGVKVQETIHRLGITYVELVELVKTRFLNPFQADLNQLEAIFKNSTLSTVTLYQQFVQIQEESLQSANEPALKAVLDAQGIDTATFDAWVVAHFGKIQEVVTLFEPNSKCDLKTTRLRSIRSVAEDRPAAGVDTVFFKAMHQFVRLQRKLGYPIHELDNVLVALKIDNLSAERLDALVKIKQLNVTLKLTLPQLAVVWGNIDTYSTKSLYAKLFLNKSVQRIDSVFQPDASGNFLTDSTRLLKDHQTAVLAAIQLTVDDYSRIAMHVGIDVETGTLSLENLSIFYRYALLAKALKITVEDLITLKSIFGIEPFSLWDGNAFVAIHPEKTAEFVQVVSDIKASGFKIPLLKYILTGTANARTAPELLPHKIQTTLRTLRESLQAIEQTYPEDDPVALTDDGLRSRLSLVFPPEVVDQAVSMLNGTIRYSTLTDQNAPINLPAELPDLAQRVRYTKASGRLQVQGVLTDSDRDALNALPGASATFKRAVDALYTQPETFLRDTFSAVFANLILANRLLLNHPAQAVEPTLLQKQQTFYKEFLPFLKKRLRQNVVVQQMATLIGLDEATTRVLLGNETGALGQWVLGGLSADYFTDIALNVPGISRLDATVDFAWEVGSADPAIQANAFSVRWGGFISPAVSGDYTFVVEVAEADDAVKLWVDNQLLFDKPLGDVRLSWEGISSLSVGKFTELRLEYINSAQKAGIRLFWQTDQTPKEIIPTLVLYPATAVADLKQTAGIFHRATLLINTLKLSTADVQHLQTYPADFDNLDFTALTPTHFQRLRAFANLRATLSPNPALLVSLLAEATLTEPGNLALFLTHLTEATGWDETILTALVTHFGFDVVSFRNELALTKLYSAFQVIWKTGASVALLGAWAQPESDFDLLNAQTQAVKNTLKAQLSEEDWQTTAGTLNDKIRENQTKALIAYLLQQPTLRDWGIQDADGLYEYFLIDVQMTACMDTSRMVQATASVQQFVSRCFLNLETRLDGAGLQVGISPETIDANRWAWMKNYRVWEANRKVFTYPENWLEPEWRDDKTEFFGELESDLLQNDITDRSVDDAFRAYLRKLADVANLKLSGMFQDEKTGILHIFGRNHADPPTYYYRTRDKYGRWSGWSKVQVAIQSVKSDKELPVQTESNKPASGTIILLTGPSTEAENGNSNGVHLTPVVWKNRLLLFWPEFLEKKSENQTANSTSFRGLEAKSAADLKTDSYWETRLAWSELRDGKWTAKQVTDEFLNLYEHPAGCTVSITIDKANPDHSLPIYLCGRDGNTKGWFTFTNIEAKPQIGYPLFFSYFPILPNASVYSQAFMAKRRYGLLQLKGNDYLKASRDHRLLFSSHITDFETLKYPFFYSDNERSYFVKTTDISYRVNTIKKPDQRFYIPLEIAKEYVTVPRFPKLTFGSEDLQLDPGVGIVGRFMDGATPIINNPQIRMAAAAPVMPMQGSSKVALPMVGNFGAQTRMVSTQRNVMATARVIGGAFSGIQLERTDSYKEHYLSMTRWDKGLTFLPFYHPFAGAFISRLNQNGVSGLLESDTQLPDDLGAQFDGTYKPNTERGYVQMPFPQVNVDFDEYGAYSLYNYELFFHAPLFIATRLSKNGQYADAMRWFHYIFDPTTNEQPAPANPNARYWKVKPFRIADTDSIEDIFRGLRPNPNPDSPEDIRIAEWRDFPFRPHRIAKGRPSAYMKNVVLKYVENLTAWGDDLFRRETRESITEATQLYVMAAHILGPKPQFVPKRGTVQTETFATLRPKLDDFGNALVQMENLFPFSSGIPAPDTPYNGSMLGVGTALYFGIPYNEKMLKYWDTVGDRLFNIRHCRNIDGIELKLALFEPPIDPGLLVAAFAKGLSIGSILSDLHSPAPLYRFTVLLQKANEFVNEVKNLGNGLLSAIEKRDAEELARKRATHESVLLTMAREIKSRQVLEAKAQKAGLEKSRDTLKKRFKYYTDLLGLAERTIPEPVYLPTTINEDTALPADTQLANVEVDVDVSLVDSEETGVKLIPKENEELTKMELAKWFQLGSNVGETLAAIFNVIPSAEVMGAPLGVGAKSTVFHGFTWGAAISALARASAGTATFIGAEANQAAKMASYIRRDQEWTMQANQAARELVQVDKQLVAADIRIQISQRELAHHDRQMSQAAEIEIFLRDKYTNQELYQWLKEQLFGTYRQSYKLALDLAKMAEKSYRFELGRTNSSFIQTGYWNSTYDGLTAGDALQLSLRQMEKSYLEENRREFELTKHISIAQLNPSALVALRQTGSCELSLPEELFDFDFAGHYFRRVKSVSLTIPCVAGPFTTINATLRLLNNRIRIDTTDGDNGYEHNQEEGVLLDDIRFMTNNIPFKAVATSSAQNDSGVFELNFRDERYLPFEGAGAISTWKLELNGKHDVGGNIIDIAQFNYDTITDVILHLRYTAREDAGLFRQKSVQHLQNVLAMASQEMPLTRLFSLRQEFSTEWHRFLHPTDGQPQTMSFDLRERFPFFTKNRTIAVYRIELVAASSLPTLNSVSLGFDPANPADELANVKLDPYAPYNGLLRQVPDLAGADKSANVWSLTYQPAAGQPARLLPENLEDVLLLVQYTCSG